MTGFDAVKSLFQA